jgi:hypothetical protein
MSLPTSVTLTRDGGYYYRALSFHYASIAVLFIPCIIVILVAVVNPFWFRNSLFNLIENKVNQLSRWRDKLKYRIYLGTDPEMWHALKD